MSETKQEQPTRRCIKIRCFLEVNRTQETKDTADAFDERVAAAGSNVAVISTSNCFRLKTVELHAKTPIWAFRHVSSLAKRRGPTNTWKTFLRAVIHGSQTSTLNAPAKAFADDVKLDEIWLYDGSKQALSSAVCELLGADAKADEWIEVPYGRVCLYKDHTTNADWETADA